MKHGESLQPILPPGEAAPTLKAPHPFRLLGLLRILLLTSLIFLLLIPIARFIPLLRPRSSRVIYITKRSLLREGLGAVLSGLRPVLLLANYTNSEIVSEQHSSTHGYAFGRYLKLSSLQLSRRKILCPMDGRKLIKEVEQECGNFNFAKLEKRGVFRDCNTLVVDGFLSHPRGCLKDTDQLVRDFTTLDTGHPVKEKRDVCVLRRGGDMEARILAGKGNHAAIDEELTLPLLHELKERGARIVVATETKMGGVAEQYGADVFSNREDLEKAVLKLNGCRCMFVAAYSSFAGAMVQILQPEVVVYMTQRDGFSFDITPFPFAEEYGERAVPVAENRKVLSLCAPEI